MERAETALWSSASGCRSGWQALWCDFQDFFYCFDPKDGKILWSVDFGQPSSGFVNAPIILPNGMMYVLSWDGNLYCIDPNGKQQWAFNSSYSFQGTPSVSTDGTVYVMSNKLYGINGLNGQKLWDFAPPNLGVLPWFFESTPVIGSDGTIYVIGYCRPFIGNALYLFAVNTNGVEKWRYQLTDGTSFISDGQRTMPALQSDGTLIVAVSGNQTVVAINPDGTKKAELALSDPLAPNASPSIDALGRIYITLRYGFTCVKEDLTTQIWSKLVTDGNNGIFFQSSPSLGSDAVYITSQDGNYSGELYAVPLGQ